MKVELEERNSDGNGGRKAGGGRWRKGGGKE